MKGYAQQSYPMSLDVIVVIDGQAFRDGIKGLNMGHAVHRAHWNWPAAQLIVPLGTTTL